MIILKIQGYINNFHIGFESKNNQIRIVLLEKSVEIAQLSKSFSRLLAFFQTEGKFIFKAQGSLRLQMVNKEIKIYFKKVLIGYVDKKDFIVAIENVEQC